MKRELAKRLSAVENFADPSAELEQYRTPTSIAAHLIHLADIHDDLGTHTVVDLGAGTGMLALGAALRGAERVVGIDIDAVAIDAARRAERHLAPPTAVDWIHGDATRSPLRLDAATVVANPPFGAHEESRHADRAFLETAVSIARVSYTIHNEGSREFVESFAADNGGTVTHAFAAAFELPKQFAHHEAQSETLEAEVFRIDWS